MSCEWILERKTFLFPRKKLQQTCGTKEIRHSAKQYLYFALCPYSIQIRYRQDSYRNRTIMKTSGIGGQIIEQRKFLRLNFVEMRALWISLLHTATIQKLLLQ